MRIRTNSAAHPIACLLMLVGTGVFLTQGCGSGSSEIGPFRFEITAASGSLLRDLFLPKQDVAFQVTRDYCDMPTEGEVQDYLREAWDFDLSRLVRISRLDLVHTTITATSGDFEVFTRLSVYYLPAGDPAGEVLLGTASSATGFGDTIVLTPSDAVDFLELIVENDAYTGSECPQMRIEVTANGVPSSDVAYQVDVSLDAYAKLRF